MRYRRLVIRRHARRGFSLTEHSGEGEPPKWRQTAKGWAPHFGVARWMAKDWYERHAWEGTLLVLDMGETNVKGAPPAGGRTAPTGGHDS